MSTLAHVCIGIQARSTSTRFPRKVFELIDGKPILRHVLDACDKAAFYLNRTSDRSGIRVSYAVLCPQGDPIKAAFGTRAMILEGSEKDVLSRYVSMASKLGADYIVRVTADCPLLPPFLISKHIKIAVQNRYDYCSNVDENVRTAIDGFDVEVISKRALDWLGQYANQDSEREHVTTLLRSGQIPNDFKVGHVVGYLNQSGLKLSVDTPEDLERVRTEYESVKNILMQAEQMAGKSAVHRV